jgi:transposase
MRHHRLGAGGTGFGLAPRRLLGGKCGTQHVELNGGRDGTGGHGGIQPYTGDVEAHDCTAFDALMAEREANPKVMLADKGYDTDDIRGQLRARGAAPEIPTKRNRKNQHTVNRALYAMRNKIERFFNRLKESRRVATRYDHKADSFLGFAKLASIKL